MGAAAGKILKALNRRFFLYRLIMILIPLSFCLAISLRAGFRLVQIYAEQAGESWREAGKFSAGIFIPHIPLLAAGGTGLLCFLTGTMLLTHTSLTALAVRMIRRPLDDLASGFERLCAGERAVGLDSPEGPALFRPLRRAFNEAAAALDCRNSGGPDPRPPLALILDSINGIEGAIHAAPGGRKKNLEPFLGKITALKHLLDQLILLTGMDRGEFPMSPEPLELGRFLEDLTGELSREYREQGLALKFEANRETLRVTLDPSWLRLALIGLLDHSARRRRLERGTAVIRYRRREGTGESSPGLAEISVTDNGPGLPSEALPFLFEDPLGPGRDPENNSLGLAITARIAGYLGGGVYAERPPRGGLSAVLCFLAAGTEDPGPAP